MLNLTAVGRLQSPTAPSVPNCLWTDLKVPSEVPRLARRSWLALLLVISLLAASVPAPAGAEVTPPPATPGPEARVALAELNLARAAMGLLPVTYSPTMAASAANHAAYLALNPGVACCDPHSERSGTPGFTGVDILERAQFAGFRGYGVAEVVAHEDAAEEAVWNWLATPYHRTPLISLRSEAAGFGAAAAGPDWNQVMNLTIRQVEATDLLAFPAGGMTAVPVGWPGLESPDPLRLFPGATGPLGFTVSLTFPANVRQLRLTTARLLGPGGEVPAYLLTPDRDEHLKGAIALLPRAPLAPATTYTAEMTGQADWGAGLQPFQRRWSFTTRGEVPRAERAAYSGRDGVLNEVRLEGRGFSAATRAYIGGAPVPVEALSDTRLRIPLPAGLAPGPADLLLAGPGGESVWTRFFDGREQLAPGPGDLTAWSLAVGERDLAAAALLPPDGADADTALLPAEALTALGATVERDPATRRWLVRLGARWVVAGPPRSAAWVGEEAEPHLGRRVDLPRPPVERDGRLYVPGALVAQLGAGVLVDAPARYVAVVPAGTPFPDTLRHWARPAVLALSRAGVVSGYPDGTFRPDLPLSRAALIRMATGARRVTPRPDLAVPLLADAADHWVTLQGWLPAAVAAGLVVPAEFPQGLLPDQPATRLEAMLMAVRALGLEAEARRRAGSVLAGFTDAAAVPPQYRGHVQLAVEKGLVSGYAEPGGGLSLRPHQQATRAEATAFVVRMLTALGG